MGTLNHAQLLSQSIECPVESFRDSVWRALQCFGDLFATEFLPTGELDDLLISLAEMSERFHHLSRFLIPDDLRLGSFGQGIIDDSEVGDGAISTSG